MIDKESLGIIIIGIFGSFIIGNFIFTENLNLLIREVTLLSAIVFAFSSGLVCAIKIIEQKTNKMNVHKTTSKFKEKNNLKTDGDKSGE